MGRPATLQIKILEALESTPDTGYTELALAVFGHAPTVSERASMRRAIGALSARGAVSTYWNHFGLFIAGRYVQGGAAIRLTESV
jgi:hypothetical protein